MTSRFRLLILYWSALQPQKRESKAFEEGWTEGGVAHTEEIEVDVEKQIEVLHVEATEDTVEFTAIFDYKQVSYYSSKQSGLGKLFCSFIIIYTTFTWLSTQLFT